MDADAAAAKTPAGAGGDAPPARLWSAVDRLVDGPADVDDLRAHRVHLFAARRWRLLGRRVPPDLAEEERSSAMVALSAEALLERIRTACDGPLVLMKGPELAAGYPDAALRPYRDIDVLVPDPESVQRSLLAAGFLPLGNRDSYYADRHHLRPLYLPALPLIVEIHRRPEWIGWSSAPSVDALLSTAVPSATGVDGFLGLAAAEHALVVAVHSWAGMPFRRLLDFVDVASVAARTDPAAITRVAERWGVVGLWQTTERAIDALFYDKPPPSSLRIWARSLPAVQDPTIVESHLRRLLAPFWVLPPREAATAALAQLARALSPAPGESWQEKITRTRRAATSPFAPLTRHQWQLVEQRRRRHEAEQRRPYRQPR